MFIISYACVFMVQVIFLKIMIAAPPPSTSFSLGSSDANLHIYFNYLTRLFPSQMLNCWLFFSFEPATVEIMPTQVNI